MRTIAGGAAQKRGVNCLKLSHTKDAARMHRCGDKEPTSLGSLAISTEDKTNHIISRRRCCTLFLKFFVSFGPRLILGAKPMSPAFGCKLRRHVWSVAAAFNSTLREKGSTLLA